MGSLVLEFQVLESQVLESQVWVYQVSWAARVHAWAHTCKRELLKPLI